MNVTFRGVSSPHKVGNIYVYPINKDLSESDINKCCTAISPENRIGSGCNGDAFALGMDLVIKKAKPDALNNKSLMNEAKKLDMLYNYEQERGCKLENVQSGIAGFELPNGESYLISTFVEGEIANPKTNPYNEQNLKSLMNILTELDKGSEKDGRLLMYDLNLNNIHLTPTKAGIFDFEHMQGENLEEAIKERVLRKQGSSSCHVSDTSNLQSNIRNYEFAGLYYYTRRMADNDIKDFLTMYLKQKSEYHSEMSKYYADLAKDSKYSKELLSIAKAEYIHSKLLEQPSDDILKAEALKIQMANFVFVSRPECGISQLKFNVEQIMDYHKKGLDFFILKLHDAKINHNKKEEVYYQNCLNLFKGWDMVQTLSDTMNNAQKSRTVEGKIKTLDMRMGLV